MVKKSTLNIFKTLAYKIHGDKYCYDLVDYKGNKIKVEIICPTHGPFWQTPNNHLKKQGCPKCAQKKRIESSVSTLENFIEKINPINISRYDYSKSNYINSYTKIEIICPDHGSFWQSPNSHLKGHGCPECAGNKKSDNKEFIKKVNPIHGFIYDYYKVNYINNFIKVEIICPEHGSFWQRPINHLNGQGCPKCGGTQRSNTIEFINKANIKYNNKYDYSKIEYINSKIKIEIICHEHGSFWQTPSNHLNGYSCPKCAHNISKLEVAWLDSLEIPNDPQYRQVKIKTNTKSFLVDGFDPITNTVYEFYGDFWHGNPKIYDSEKENKAIHKTFGELYIRTTNKEQILKDAGYNIISIWESDFNKQQKVKDNLFTYLNSIKELLIKET